MHEVSSAALTPAVAALLAANAEVLQQGQALLAAISDEQFTQTQPPLFAYGVGSHLRHCLDAYTVFLQGLSSGRVDYDARARDERLARDRQFAGERLRQTLLELLERVPVADEAADEAAGQKELQVRQDGPQWAASSVARELQFLLSHTVHHFALIALLLRWQGFFPPEEFGVAPATLTHWQTLGRS